jgi:hypothetical protein
MNARRLFILATLSALTLAGCSKQTAQNSPGASSDSLLASSPVEHPAGQIQPETNMPPQTAPATTPPNPAPLSQQPVANQTPEKPKPSPSHKPAPPAEPSATVAQGTPLKITVGSGLSSETATLGQEWTGSIAEAVTVGSMAPFPAGSTVHGVVDGVQPAAKGDRAVLVLRVTSIESNGKSHVIAATADSIIAGSTRTRNVGAVAGGAAAGALLGRAIGGSGKGALIGGILGGGAAATAVAKSKGYQAVVKEGSELVFHVDHDTKLRL